MPGRRIVERIRANFEALDTSFDALAGLHPQAAWPRTRMTGNKVLPVGALRCLARSLGTTLGITPVHLDGLYYDRDWMPPNKEQFAALQRDLVAEPQWIIDANYASTRPIRLAAADTVIFLTSPPGHACAASFSGGSGQLDLGRVTRAATQK